MRAEARRWCQLAALLLALATLIGAVGAHALKGRLSADRYEVLQTALQYQFFHALGLMALGVLLDRLPRPALRVAGWAYVLQTGRVVASGDARELAESELIKRAFLGL